MKILFLTFIFLGAVASVYMETCPPAEYIYPCSCKQLKTGDITVVCADQALDLQRLKYSLSNLYGKEDVNLILNGLRLGSVPSTFFYGIYIKRLQISNCYLQALTDDSQPILYGLEDTLQELTITSSFREDYGPAKLQVGHLTRLREINLSFNGIAELGNEWFESAPRSLEYLTLYNNNIGKIGQNAFANLIYLRQLSLVGNRFGAIQRTMLPVVGYNLQVLELDNNALTHLPEDIFTSMPVLSSVSLRQNGISKLDQRTWYPIWQQLNVLRLEDNRIQCDGHLNWLFEIKRAAAVYGRCYSPREFQGYSLQELIDSRSRARNL